MQKNCDVVNLLVATDRNYISQTHTTIVSVRANLQKCHLIVYVAYYSDEPINVDVFKTHLCSDDQIIDLPLPRRFQRTKFAGRFNEAIMLRLIAPYSIPDDIDRILYLDSDVIANGDILPFYKRNEVNSNALCGTREWLPWSIDPSFLSPSGEEEISPYLNSGVMVINLRLWKRRYPDLSSFLSAARSVPKPNALDQDILNWVFRGNKYSCGDDKYMRFCDKYHTIHTPASFKAKKPVFYHFAGPHKPWQILGMPNYRRIYWKYGRKTYPWTFRINLATKRFLYILLFPKRAILRRLKRID